MSNDPKIAGDNIGPGTDGHTIGAGWPLFIALPVDMADAPYPFAEQTLERQKRKHETLRGSESRIVRSAGSSNFTGIVPLFSLQGATKAFESLIEKDFWVVLDFVMRDVIDARAQPGVLEITVGSRIEQWYPDMWIRRSGCRDLLVECKPAEVLHPDAEKYPADALYMEARVEGMQRAAHEMNMDFEIFTELEIRTEPRLHNAKTMRRGLSSHVPEVVLKDAERRLRALPSVMTVRELSVTLGAYAGMGMAVACCLDREGHIELDRESYFLPETTLLNLKVD